MADSDDQDATAVSQPDPRFEDILATISATSLQVIENQELRGQAVYLDGRHFRNCSFITVVIEGEECCSCAVPSVRPVPRVHAESECRLVVGPVAFSVAVRRSSLRSRPVPPPPLIRIGMERQGTVGPMRPDARRIILTR